MNSSDVVVSLQFFFPWKQRVLSKVVAVICPPNSSWLGPKAAFTVQKLQFQAWVNKILGHVITTNADCKRHALWQFLRVKSTLERGFGCRNTHRKKKKKKKPRSLHQAHYQKPVCHSKLRHAWKGKALSDAFQ